MGYFGKKTEKQNQSSGATATLENGVSVSITSSVDCMGDSCPRPQLMLCAALGKASAGDIIEVKVDNPTSMEALPPIIIENGGIHLGTLREPRHWQVLAQKS